MRNWIIFMTFFLLSCTSEVKTSYLPREEYPGSLVVKHFHNGVCYRRPGSVVQLSVSGNHHEMGIQYGVLLQNEIKESAEKLNKLLNYIAGENGIPLSFLFFYFDLCSDRITGKIPKRFIEEMKGVAEGAGIDFRTIKRMNTLYDIFQLLGCTSILARDKNGGLVHGRTLDLGWGNDWPETVLVQFRPEGYHSFISVSWPGFLGTQTSYNNAGITYSENTLKAVRKNPGGLSVNYLSRMIMEECANLDESARIFNKYPSISGESLILGDLNEKKGGAFEITPLVPVSWHVTWETNSVLWAVNRYLFSGYRQNVEDVYRQDNGNNRGRMAILSKYLQAGKSYGITEMINILRLSAGPDGKDYLKDPRLRGVCNQDTLQMTVFDPSGRGIYLSYGRNCASRSEVMFYPADFEQEPQSFMKAETVEPETEEAFGILNSILPQSEKLKKWLKLTDKFPESAFIQANLAYCAFENRQMKIFTHSIEKAHQLDPDNSDLKLDMASVLYREKKYSEASDILEKIKPKDLCSYKYQIIRLALLDKIARLTGEYRENSYREELFYELKDKPEAQKDLCKFIDRLNKYNETSILRP